MGGEIELLDLAESCHLASAGTEHEGFALFGGLKTATGSVGIGIADKEDCLVGIANHPHAQVMSGRIFAHHAGGDDKEASASQLHSLGLALFQHDEIERFAQLKMGTLPVCAVRFQIVDL